MTGPGDRAAPRRRFLLGDFRRFDYDYTSGIDHDAADPSFSSLLSNGFFFPDDGDDDDFREDAGDNSDGLDPPTAIPAADMLRDVVRLPPGDRYGRALTREVTRAVERFAALRREEGRAVLLRAVMGFLKEGGYDAGVCKARWGSGKGITPGSYEYIDVVRVPPRGERSFRYIVDVNFAAEFEIARPTAEYERAVGELPDVYVGTAEELKRVVTVMADAAKRSLKSRGLHVPPWRKRNYMRAKWLGPYRRTTNLVLSSAVELVRVAKGNVACHTIGFEPPSQVVVFRLAAKTR